jgi:hypothetical protein
MDDTAGRGVPRHATAGPRSGRPRSCAVGGRPALALRVDSQVVDWRAMDHERGPDGGTPDVELPEFDEFHRLLASVEELRALLAPLSDEERQRVLDLARSLRHGPGPTS